jgi:hypothetical protein
VTGSANIKQDPLGVLLARHRSGATSIVAAIEAVMMVMVVMMMAIIAVSGRHHDYARAIPVIIIAAIKAVVMVMVVMMVIVLGDLDIRIGRQARGGFIDGLQ